MEWNRAIHNKTWIVSTPGWNTTPTFCNLVTCRINNDALTEKRPEKRSFV